jgi:hypothetical protein
MLSLTDYDGSTTATVSLQLASAEAATLYFSTEPFVPASGGYSTTGTAVSVPQDPSSRHDFVLTNLTPGTTYYYYVVYGTKLTSQQHWTTGIGSSSFRFVAYGDSQPTTTAMRDVERDIVRLANSFHPNLVIRTGDLVDSDGTMGNWDYFFAIERPMLSSAIFLPTTGNHEGSAPTNFYSLFALPQVPASEQYYAVKYNNTLFISLNTQIDIPTQATWLGNTLDAANTDPEIRWKVAYFHQPAYSSGYHQSNMTVRNAWHPLFRDKGVRLVFSGHDHDFEYLVSEGVNYYVIGGAGIDQRAFGAILTESKYQELVYHAVVVDVADTQLTVTPYRRDGSVITQAAVSLSTP